MSDFIFSRVCREHGVLTKSLQTVMQNDRLVVNEYHGSWGSLAVSENIYDEYQPLETDRHICVVIGGPLRYFQEVQLIESESVADISGTQAILTQCLVDEMLFDEHLSGPFVILIVDKESRTVQLFTDMMSFIPCYVYESHDNVMLSTHVDALAFSSNQISELDKVSLIDFILHGLITYPYTSYQSIRQIAPASRHTLLENPLRLSSTSYWIPLETQRYKSIGHAAEELRKSLKNFVDTAVRNKTEVAQFISGGEDSRIIAAMLPRDFSRDAIIFLDSMNREGKIAQKAADAYGANYKVFLRSKTHYLNILPFCHDLIGSGSQYHHVHTFGLHQQIGINKYSVVFGGLLSDALIKGSHIKKIGNIKRFPFLPQIKNRRYDPSQVLHYDFNRELLDELQKRRKSHLAYVREFRPDSAEEWFDLWPSSMNMNIPNIHGNRRLFRSYEPFTDKEVVKLSAGVPQSWKLNRRLFYLTAKPLLKQTKWLFHGEGRLPYFPWYANTILQFCTWSFYQFTRKLGVITHNQGPWSEWKELIKTPLWTQLMDKYADTLEVLARMLTNQDVINMHNFSYLQKINILQTMYGLSKSNELSITFTEKMMKSM